jgi:hypothetical protein
MHKALGRLKVRQYHEVMDLSRFIVLAIDGAYLARKREEGFFPGGLRQFVP